MNMMFPCERLGAASIEEGMPSGRSMEASEAWGERWRLTASPIAKRYMNVAATKRSLVCLAADRTTMAGLFDLIETVAPYVAALKTHVDLVDDWSPEAWGRFCKAAHEADLLIFEDRKFADIGKISRAQMSGIYDVRSWSDLVTAHLISGPDVVDGLQAGWKDANREEAFCFWRRCPVEEICSTPTTPRSGAQRVRSRRCGWLHRKRVEA